MTEVVSLLAIPLALASNMLVAAGYVLQKKAAQSFPKIETKSFKENLKTFFTSKLWLTGLVLTIFSFPTSIAAYSYGNIALVNGIGGTAIVFLTVFSKWLLKEEITKKEYVGLILIVLSISAAGFFSSGTVTQETFPEFWSATTKLSCLIFLVILLVVAQSPLISSNIKNEQLKGIIYAVAAGIYMSIDIISMKGLSIPLFKWEKEYLLDWRFLLIALVVMISPNIATIMLQYAYQKHKAIIVVPIYNNLVLIIPIVFGALFLQEWSALNTLYKLLLILSLLLVVTGTLVLSYKKGISKQKERNIELLKEV